MIYTIFMTVLSTLLLFGIDKPYMMKNIFIINGGHEFAHSPGRFNQTLLSNSKDYFAN